MTPADDIGIVVIGRNEGQRLIVCLDSLVGRGRRIVYVDSGSTDGSVDAARTRGAEVVALDMTVPFTAARARNEGLERLLQIAPTVQFVQFVDGDCEMREDWIDRARDFLTATTDVVAVAGRLRERFPEASIYNRIIDQEWDTPVGDTGAVGGIAMYRVAALQAAGGFNPAVIAGEEPELCVRLRRKGGKIWRLDAEMALHDAALDRFGQIWQRSRRGGFAYAMGYDLHGAPPERHCARPLLRCLVWGLALPLVTVLGGLLVSPWIWALLLLWPVKVLRLRLRGEDWLRATFLTFTMIPEALGALTYLRRRITGAQARLIEYK